MMWKKPNLCSFSEDTSTSRVRCNGVQCDTSGKEWSLVLVIGEISVVSIAKHFKTLVSFFSLQTSKENFIRTPHVRDIPKMDCFTTHQKPVKTNYTFIQIVKRCLLKCSSQTFLEKAKHAFNGLFFPDLISTQKTAVQSTILRSYRI